jgi:hypothetical protein
MISAIRRQPQPHRPLSGGLYVQASGLRRLALTHEVARVLASNRVDQAFVPRGTIMRATGMKVSVPPTEERAVPKGVRFGLTSSISPVVPPAIVR